MAVARKREAPLKQSAKDFGISEGCISNWLKKAGTADGNRPGLDDADRKELREAKKRSGCSSIPAGLLPVAEGPRDQRDWDGAHAINTLRDIHEDDPTLGYRFLTDELGDAGVTALENLVWRLCSIAGVFASHHRRRAQARKPGPPVHDDLLAQVDEHHVARHDFTASGPAEKRLTDMTEHPTRPHS